MSSLPAALNFPAAEEEICKKWAEEETFRNQDKLSLERGDEVCSVRCNLHIRPEEESIVLMDSW